MPPRASIPRPNLTRGLGAVIVAMLLLASLAPLSARAAQSDDLPGVDDDSYESPTYSYILEWDDRDWKPVDATTDEDDGDLLILTNEVSTLYISGIAAYDGDERVCSIDIGEVVASPDAADLYPSESGDRDLDPEDYSYLVDCRELVEDDAVLLIVHVFPADKLGGEVVEVEAVTETIDLSAASTANSAEEDPEPSDDDFAAAGVDGDSYESPEFGYTLEWDEDIWEVSDATASSDSSFLNLVNDGSSLIISGIAGMGDAEGCLEPAVAFYSEIDGVDNWELLEDDDGDQVEGSTPRRAYAAYAYTAVVADGDDGDGDDYVNYIECRPLDDDAAILISHLTIAADYDDQSALRENLLDSLELP